MLTNHLSNYAIQHAQHANNQSFFESFLLQSVGKQISGEYTYLPNFQTSTFTFWHVGINMVVGFHGIKIVDGSIDIAQTGSKSYTITFDLTTEDEKKITGKYSGVLLDEY